MSVFSITGYPRSWAIWMIVSRVMPGRIDADKSGVEIVPSRTTKMFSPEPSAMKPPSVSRIASSYPARFASVTASIELR